MAAESLVGLSSMENDMKMLSNEKQVADIEKEREVIDLHNEVMAYQEEKTTTLSHLQQVEASLKNLENQLEQQVKKNSEMQKTNEDLVLENSKLQNEVLHMQREKSGALASIVDLESKLVEVKSSLQTKIALLHEEKDASLLELHASQASIKTLESIVEKQNETISSLQQANDELQNTITSLTEESEKANVKMQEEIEAMNKQLNLMRKSLHAKIAALNEEKDAAQLELLTSQASVRNIESVVEKQNEHISSLRQANDKLQKTITTLTEESEKAKEKLQDEIEAMDKQLTVMRKSLHAKIAALHEEKDTTVLELQASHASARKFECAVQKKNEDISSLRQVNDELQKTITILTKESEKAKAKLQDEIEAMDKQLTVMRKSLHAKIAALHEEKDTTVLELQASQASSRKFESVVEKQKEDILSLRQANDEMQKTITTLTEESEKAKTKLQDEIEAMDKQLIVMRKSLHAKIAALHEEKDATQLKLQASQASVRKFERVVEKKKEDILSLHQANDDLQQTICTMTEETEKAKAKLQEEIKAMDKQLVEMRRSLYAKIVALQEERDATLLDLQASQAYMRNIDSVVEKHIKSISSEKQANDDLQKAMCTLTEKSERAKAQFQQELVEVRRGLHAKILALNEEKDATQLKLQAAQASIRNFESVVEEQNKRISSLQQANDELQRTMYTLTEQSEQTKAKLQEEVKAMEMQLVEVRRSLHVKIVALNEEKDAAQLELQTSQASVRNIESVVLKQNEDISSLRQANDELQKTITTLTEESEKAKTKLQDEIEAMDKQLTVMRKSLHAKIAALHEEKDAALLELQASQASARNFESVVEKQTENILSLHQANDDLQRTIYTMTEETEKAKAKLQEEIKAMDKQLLEMKRSLHSKIVALHEERDAALLDLQASQAYMRNIDSVVEKHIKSISSEKQANDDLQKAMCTLTEKSERAKAQFQQELVEVRRGLHAKILALNEEKDATQLKLQAAQASIRNFESVVEEQNKRISSLQQANDELQRTMYTLTEQSEQTKAKLQEEVKAMEMQLVEVRRNLHVKIAALNEEKDAAQLELQTSQASVRNIGSVVLKQNEDISSLRQANDELQKTITTLTEESEKAKTKLQDEIEAMDKQLTVMRKSLHAKIAALHEEKDAALLELQASQASARNFESVVEKQTENILSLHQANDDLQRTIYTMTEETEKAKAKLQEEIKAMDKQLLEMRRSLHSKIAALHEERDAALLDLQASQAYVRNIDSVVEKHIKSISSEKQTNDDLQKAICTLSEKSERAKAQFQEELVEVRRGLQAKVVTLREEKDATQLKLQAAQASIRNFESVVEEQNKRISSLQQANDELQRTMYTLTEQCEQTKAKLQEKVKAMEMQLVEVRRSLHVKIAALNEEKDAAQLELQTSQASVRNIESVVEKQKEDILSLRQANDELQKTITTLTEESEKAKTKLQDEIEAMDKQLTVMRKSLHAKIAALHEEKDAALLELQASQASARNYESLVEKQTEDILSLHRANDDLQRTICTMTEETEKAKAKLQEEIKAMDKQLLEMRRSLHSKIAALHEERDAALLDLQASQAYVRNIDSVVEKHIKSISSQKQTNDDLQKAICTLSEKSERAKAQFQVELVEVRRGLHAKVAALREEKDATQLKLQAAQASIRNFESVVEEQNKRISSLQQANDELQRTMYTLTEQSEQTKAKLQEEVKAMEMQLVEVRRNLHVKIAALNEEKDAAQLELQTSQASVRNIGSVVLKQNEDISSLRQANDELQKTITTLTEESEKAKTKLQDEIEAMDKQLTVMRKSLHAKIAALHEEKDAALLELQASQASARNFESVVEKQTENIISLHQANDDLQRTIYTMTEETEKAKAKLQEEIKAMDKQLLEMRRSLHSKIAALHEERDAALLDLQASQAYVRNIDSVVEKHIKSISSEKQTNDDLQKAICTLSEKSERAKAQFQEELVEVRRGLQAKVVTLREEKDATQLKLQAAQASIRNFESVVEEQNKRISSLQQANDELQRTMYTLTEQCEQTKAKLQEKVKAMEMQLVEVRRSLHVKIAALNEEKDAAQLELQTSQASVRNIESVVEKQKEDILSLRQANDELQKTITTLTEESEKAKTKLQDEIEAMDKQLTVMRKSLHAKIAALHEEKDAALLELQASQASARNYESLVEKQTEDILSLHRANDDLQRTICTMTEETEKAKAKLQEEIKAMDKQLLEMRRSLHSKIAALHEERDAALLDLQASQAYVRNIDSVVEKHIKSISSQKQTNDDLQKAICTLSEKSERAKAQFQVELVEVRRGLHAKVAALREEKDATQLKLQVAQASIRSIESVVEEQNKRISSLQQANDELQRTMYTLTEQSEQTKAKLQEEVKAMEMQLVEVRRSLHVKIAALNEEKYAAQLELQTSQASVKNIESVVLKQNEDISSLRQANDELQKTITTLTEELENAKTKLQDEIEAMDKQLTVMRKSLHAKIAALHDEKDAALLELQASQASARNFERVVEKQTEDILSLHRANDDMQRTICTMTEETEKAKAKLQEEIKAMDKQLLEMRRSLHSKIAALHEERDAALLDLQASQAYVRNIDSVVEKHIKSISSEKQTNDDLQKAICTLSEKSERAKAQFQVELVEVRRGLHAKVAALREEKDATQLKLQAAQASIRSIESVVEEQNKRISSLQQANDELQRTMYTLTEQSEQTKAKLQEEVKAMEMQLVEVRRSLHVKIAALNEEKYAAQLELQTSQASVKNIESVVLKQNEDISSLRQANDELQKTITTLTEESEKAKTKLQDEIEAMDKQLTVMRKSLHAKIAALHDEKDAALLELQASQASARNFESVVEKQTEDILSLHRANDDMQRTICTMTEETEKAKAKLQEEIKAMDKQLLEMRRSLHSKIAALHEERDAALSDLQASQAYVRNIDSVVEKHIKSISSEKQTNDDLQKAICTLSEKSERAKAQFQVELVEVRRGLHAKVAALREEKDATQLKLQAAQASIRSIESVVEEQNKRISSLQQANDELQRTMYTLTEQSEQTKAKLQEEVKDMEMQLVEVRRSLHVKIAALNEEKYAAQLELQTSQASVKNIETVVLKQNEDISSLRQANDELQKTITTLTEESEKAKTKLQDEIEAMDKQLTVMRKSLHAKIAALHEEKDAALLELQASQASARNFESVVEKQTEDILSLHRANDDMQRTICTMTEETEKAKAKLQEEIKAMDKQLLEMRRSLHSKIAALHEERDAALLDLQASQAYVRNIDSVVEKHIKSISSEKQTNDDLQKAICTLSEKSERAKAQFQVELVEVRRGLHAKVAALREEKDATQLKLQAAQASIRSIESVVEEQNKRISSLQQANDELQRTMYTLTEQSEQTKAKLQEEVKAMEMQLVEVRRSLHVKIAALNEEKYAAQLELQTSQASVKNIETVVLKQNEDISSLRQANDELQKTITTLTEESEKAKTKLQDEIEAMDKQLTVMRKSLHAKIAALHEEKDAALLELQASQASARNFESVVEKQTEDILSLHRANDDMQRTICTMTEETEKAKAKLQEEIKAMDKQLLEMRRSLHSKIAALHEGRDAALLDLQASQAYVRNIDSVVEKHIKSISSQKQTNDDLQKAICTLSEKSERAKAQFQEEVVEVRRGLHAKVAALHEEKDATQLKLQAAQASIRNFESVVEEQNKRISFLHESNDDLQKTITILIEESAQIKAKFKEQIEVKDKQLIEMRRNLDAKVASLHEENDAVLLKLQASQTSVRNYESAVEKQNEYILSLQEANDVLHKEIGTLTEQSQQANGKLLMEIKASQKEKDMVISQLKQSEALIKDLENEVARLKNELSIQQENNFTLDKQLQKFQAEMARNIIDLSLNTKALENTINVLSYEKTKVEEDLKIFVQACSGNMSSMKEFEDTVKQRIRDDVTKLGPLYHSLGEVLSSYRKLQYAYDEVSARAYKLEVLKTNQMEQIDKINQLKEEKLNTFMENAKLHKNVQYLEFQLQHVKQKLMENKWKEDRFATTLVTSQAEIQNLEQLVSLLEETLEDVKEHAELGVLNLTEQLDKLESSFNQGFPRFVYRSSTSSEEIKVMRKKLQDHLDQQKELLKKKEELAIRLRNKEKVLSEMVKSDVEERNLEKEVDEKESRGEITNNTVTASKRWPSLRRRRWRRNSYSC